MATDSLFTDSTVRHNRPLPSEAVAARPNSYQCRGLRAGYGYHPRIGTAIASQKVPRNPPLILMGEDGSRGVTEMLVLSRKVGEQIVVPQCQLTVTVLEATAGRVRLGIVAPPSVAVHRREVGERIRAAAVADNGGSMMSIRILIADPDECLSSSYREHFTQQGAVVATAANALVCVERLRDFAPDVLVMEPALLWGGGDGILALMHEEPDLRPASVLLLTQGGNRSLLYRLSPFKVDDYQTKPLSPRRLMQRIRTLRFPRPLDIESGSGMAPLPSASAILPR